MWIYKDRGQCYICFRFNEVALVVQTRAVTSYKRAVWVQPLFTFPKKLLASHCFLCMCHFLSFGWCLLSALTVAGPGGSALLWKDSAFLFCPSESKIGELLPRILMTIERCFVLCPLWTNYTFPKPQSLLICNSNSCHRSNLIHLPLTDMKTHK